MRYLIGGFAAFGLAVVVMFAVIGIRLTYVEVSNAESLRPLAEMFALEQHHGDVVVKKK